MAICVAVVEDEKRERELIKKYLASFGEERGVVFNVHEFEDGLSFLSDYKSIYDVVFMDIELPGMNGMEASRRLREIDGNIVLVFVTNMAQYAIRGYEVGATDFIVKPVHYYDFRLKLERAVSHIDMQTQQKISIKIDDSIKCVRAGDIMYVEGIKHKLVFHTVNETLETYGTLKQVEAVLSGANFVRCNQCYLVNLSRGGWCCSDLST